MARSRIYPEPDPFTFMIGVVDTDGNATEALAGANNVSAARAAFSYLVSFHRPHTKLQLRQRGRIMVRENGTAVNVYPFAPSP